MDVDPRSTEIRYTLDLMAYYLQAMRPRRVRIASRSGEIVKAVVRRLGGMEVSLLVETPGMQALIRDSLGLELRVFEPGTGSADVALFPFSLEEGLRPAGEPAIVVASRNALSYKSLLYPGKVRKTVWGEMAKLRPDYKLEPVCGLYPPQFVLLWALAKGVERLDSAWYFRLEDRAMRRLVEFGPLWRLSYIVLLVGRLAG